MNSSFELLFRDALERRHRGCFDEAGKIYEQILRQEPGNAKALHLLGVVAAQTGRMERGAELMQRSIAENSGIAPVWADLGRALIALGRFDEAVSSFDEAIALKPDMALAHFNRGVALDDLNRLDEALECYDRVIALDPEDPEAHYNRGLVLRRLLRFDQALLSYDRAIALNPDYTHAYLNRGNILSDLKRYDEAIACFDRVTALEPGYPGIQSLRLGVKRQQCGWHSLDRETADVERGIREGEVADPFSLLGFFDDPSLLRQATENYVNTHCPPNAALGPFGTVSRNSKIRVGYFSGDFHEHATAYLMADLFESHDRDRFEITAFSFGPDAASKMRQRLGLAFDHFVDVQDSTDLAVAQQARALKIDIAVDLKGYTIDSREGIFAYRAAPIQVNYLGFPGTMAAPFMDYIVADHTLIPTSDRDHYSEKIVYLPHSYQPNDRKKLISDRVFTRDQLGLPAEGFVFCCFNNSYKLTPEVFSVWMRVLQRVPRSESNMARAIAGTPANTKTLPIWNPGAAEIGLSISVAVSGTWAMRKRASFRGRSAP